MRGFLKGSMRGFWGFNEGVFGGSMRGFGGSMRGFWGFNEGVLGVQ